MQLAVKNAEGEPVRTIQVDDHVFGIAPNPAVLHQAFVAQRANQRRGTVSTLTRGEVAGSTRKIRPQKYTGRARQGSIRAPHRPGGGVVFGPKPRDYSQRLPKNMKRLAIRSALSGKVADGELTVIDQLAFQRPRTKEMERILLNLGVERSALIVTAEPDRNVFLAARNLPKRKVLPASYLNVVDMLTHQDLVMTEGAVRRAEALWGTRAAAAPVVEEPAPATRRVRRAAKAAEEPAPEAAQPAPPSVAVARPRRRPRPQAQEEKTAAEAGPQPTPRPSRAKKAAPPAEGVSGHA